MIHCLLGVFTVGPCRCEPSTFGTTIWFPEAYVIPPLDTLDAEGEATVDEDVIALVDAEVDVKKLDREVPKVEETVEELLTPFDVEFNGLPVDKGMTEPVDVLLESRWEELAPCGDEEFPDCTRTAPWIPRSDARGSAIDDLR